MSRAHALPIRNDELVFRKTWRQLFVSRSGALKFGSQCIAISIDCKKVAPDHREVLQPWRTKATGLDAVEWATRAVNLGVG
jgi:cyclase